jgi:hypothetical protein
MVLGDSDTSPLLGSNSNTTSKKDKLIQQWKSLRRKTINHKLHIYVPIALISLIMFSLACIFFIRVKPNLGLGVAEGTYFDTDNVKLLGLGDSGGIDLQISGTNINNYTNIEDYWIRNYFAKGGFIIRQLNLKIKELDLIVFDSNKNEALNLGKVEIMPFYVNVVDKSSTPMDLFVTLWPNGKGVRGVIKKLLLDSDAKLRLRGDADVLVYVFNGFIPISSISVPLDIEFK